MKLTVDLRIVTRFTSVRTAMYEINERKKFYSLCYFLTSKNNWPCVEFAEVFCIRGREVLIICVHVCAFLFIFPSFFFFVRVHKVILLVVFISFCTRYYAINWRRKQPVLYVYVCLWARLRREYEFASRNILARLNNAEHNRWRILKTAHPQSVEKRDRFGRGFTFV